MILLVKLNLIITDGSTQIVLVDSLTKNAKRVSQLDPKNRLGFSKHMPNTPQLHNIYVTTVPIKAVSVK
jgi:hypothetical protein